MGGNVSRIWGEQGARVQEGGPRSWLVRREGEQQRGVELVRCEDQRGRQAKGSWTSTMREGRASRLGGFKI